MTAPSLLDELEGVVNLMNDPTKYSDQIGQAAVEFLNAHHAELADMANELRVARESFKRCDEICKCTAEGWRTAEEDMAKRLEAAERDARATKRSAETLCRIYFEIAAEAVGEDKVRAERDRRIHATQEGEG